MMGPRGDAAMKMLGALGGGGAGEEMPDETGMPGMGDEAALSGEALEAGGIEDALAGVEAALSTLSEGAANEIRSHLEAIRDIASREPQNKELPADPMADAAVPPVAPDAPVEPAGFEEPMPS